MSMFNNLSWELGVDHVRTQKPRGGKPRGWLQHSVLALLTAILLTLAPVASATAIDGNTTMGVGTVIDREMIFFNDQTRFIEARTIENAELRWRSEEPGRPLAVVGSLLLVQTEALGAGELRLAWMDAATGIIERRLASPLPRGVIAHIGPTANQQFQISAHATSVAPGAGQGIAAQTLDPLRLYWSFEATPLRGAALPESPPQQVEGVLEVSLGREGGARPVANAPAPAAQPIDLAQAARLAGVTGRQFRSNDDRHIVATTALNHGLQHRWQLFDRSGAGLADLTLRVAYAPFLLSGSQVLVRLPAMESIDGEGRRQSKGEQLVAFSLASGQQLWALTLADSRYRGPMPP